MADEQDVTIIGGIDAGVRALRQDVTDLKVSMGRMEGRFEQMDKRLSSFETTVDKRLSSVETAVIDLRKENRQSFSWMIGMWITTILAILTMSLTIFSRIR